MDLITATQAQAVLPGLSAGEAAALPGLCGPASRAVEAWCGRKLGFGSYVEFHRPGRTRTIRLKNPPIAPGSVELRADLEAVLTFGCVDPAAMRATASFTATALTLASSSASAPPAAVIPIVAGSTAATLAADIAGTPNWQATVNPAYGGWLVADLEPNPGMMGALGGGRASLSAFVRDLSCWAMDDPCVGRVELTEARPQAFRYPDRMWAGSGFGLGGGFGSPDPRSADVRCAYSAGYDPLGVVAPSVPADLLQGVALVIRGMLDSGQFSGALTSIELGNSKVTVGTLASIPTAAMGFLSAYVLRSL